MASRAMRKRLSSPEAVMRQGRPIASKPSATRVPSLSTFVTHAHPPMPRATHASLFSPGGIRLTRGTWTIPSASGPNGAARTGAAAADAVHHIGERSYDLRIDILRRRVDEAH